MEKVAIEKIQLQRAIEYINTLLDFVDIEEEENINYIKDGYNNLIQPISDIAFDDKNIIDNRVIAKQADIEIFKENLEYIYDIDTTNITDEQIVEIFESVEDGLANDDQYAEIYNDVMYQVLKKFNII